MSHRLATSVKFLDDVIIELTYLDGKVVQFDMSTMFEKYPQLIELRTNRKLFLSGKLDSVGYAVIWNDELDFDATSIYFEGKVVGQVDTTIYQKIGVLVALTRNELNITQVELAKMSKVDQGDICRIERGLGNPTLRKIDKLFKAMGKEVNFSCK